MKGQHKRKTLIKKIIFYSAVGVVAIAIIIGSIFAFGGLGYNPNTFNQTNLLIIF